MLQGFTLNKFLLYDYEENYNASILSCPFDRIVYGSRVYHMLYLAHDSFQQDNPCDLKKKRVDVLFVSYAGTDSSEILFDVIKAKTNFSVYLGSPYLPVQVKAPWAIDKDLLPPFFEFTKRVYKSYLERFDSYGKLFGGIYQAYEVYALIADVFVQQLLPPEQAALQRDSGASPIFQACQSHFQQQPTVSANFECAAPINGPSSFRMRGASIRAVNKVLHAALHKLEFNISFVCLFVVCLDF